MYLNILLNSDDLLPSELKYFRCLFELIHKPICHCQNLLEFSQNSLYCKIMICETLMFENARMRDWCLLVKTLENSWSSATKTSLHNLPVSSLKMFYRTKFTFLPFEASINLETGRKYFNILFLTDSRVKYFELMCSNSDFMWNKIKTLKYFSITSALWTFLNRLQLKWTQLVGPRKVWI